MNPVRRLLPTIHDIRTAAKHAADAGAVGTPLVRLEGGTRGTDIYLKLESLQPTGSFTIRGMGNALAAADPIEPGDAVWTVSTGNAGLGLARAAAAMGLPCSVVVPDTAPATKRDAMEGLGAEVISAAFEDWLEAARIGRVDRLEGLFVHPFSDSAVMAGNGTIALEILEDLPTVGSVLVPWGGGGLACGIGAAFREAAPRVRVFACEFEPTAPLAASLEAGEPVEVAHAESFIDGIGAPLVFPEMFELAQLVLDGSLTVPIDEVRHTLRTLAEGTGVVAEGAGAVAPAVALSGAAGPGPVVCVVSGRNIDLHRLGEILSG